jgi:hypothetical protein
VNGAELTLAKQADLLLCGSVSTGTISKRFIEKSKFAQHAYEEGHKLSRDEARILEIGSNSSYGQY